MAQPEIKVLTSTWGSFGASIGVAVLNAVIADNSLLGNMPPWLQFIVISLIPTALTFLGGYAMPSRTSTVSNGYKHE